MNFTNARATQSILGMKIPTKSVFSFYSKRSLLPTTLASCLAQFQVLDPHRLKKIKPLALNAINC
jgi:hypothetical protein